jgi:hypothetical protein
VTLLIAQLDGEQISDDELLFEPELVVRATTAPAPATGDRGVPEQRGLVEARESRR